MKLHANARLRVKGRELLGALLIPALVLFPGVRCGSVRG